MRGFLILCIVFLIAYITCVPSRTTDLPQLGAIPVESTVRDTLEQCNPLTRLSRSLVRQMELAPAELEALR